jgi:hypothetical protein
MWRTSAVLVIPFAMYVAPSYFSKCASKWVARLAPSNVLFALSSVRNRQCSCGCEGTVPHFTFILLENFVNLFSSVSTGFFRFFSVLFEIMQFLGDFREFRLRIDADKHALEAKLEVRSALIRVDP